MSVRIGNMQWLAHSYPVGVTYTTIVVVGLLFVAWLSAVEGQANPSAYR